MMRRATPPLVGGAAGLDAEATFRWASALGPNTAPFNLSGHAAASLPAGLSPAGLPMGVQLVGRDDAVLLAVCRQMEALRPWAPLPDLASLSQSPPGVV